MAELLLELLSEEIPARMQARAAEDIRRLVIDGMKTAGLSFDSARAFVTPRRLALVVEGLPLAQPDISEEKRGPRVGAPDQAVQGFLKGVGLASLYEAEKRDTGKGEFWFAVINRKGGPAAAALPGVIEAAMKALPWPKSMKWGSGSMLWVRPLLSVVALFDGKTLAGEIAPGGQMAPVKFGDTTRGHRFLSKGGISVTGFADYEAKLRAAHVILDPAERKRIVLEGAQKLCVDGQVALKADDGLLDEVAGLVEWPVPLSGTIDAQFMDVPPEVLIVSMRTHLRYFATTGQDGALARRFVVVANTIARDGGKTIVEGNERVLRARLSDAKFFWDQDRKSTLESRLPALKNIVFHARLGTQAERVERITKLAGRIAKSVTGANATDVELAARLCKADLVSGMVGEFPELQGIMGYYYAKAEKLPDAVAVAIGDHYAPVGQNDRCPSAPVSIVLALADKLDMLVAFWAIDEQPTGSRDPYALRRAALGCLRLIIESKIRIPLSELLRAHYEEIVYRNWTTVERVIDYLNQEARDLEEERVLISLIEASPAKSYFAEGNILREVSVLFGNGSDLTLRALDTSNAVDVFMDRAIDIQLMSGSPNARRSTTRTMQQRDMSSGFDATEHGGAYLARLRAHTGKYVESMITFLADRLKVQARERGMRHDVIDAVFALGGEDDLVRLMTRVEALQSFLGSEAGANLLAGYKRAVNIVRAEERKDKTLAARIAGAPDVALLEQTEEKAVASVLAEVERAVGPALAREDFAGAMAAFATLRAPIDAFFEKVTVNVADNPELRLNRLRLLNQIRATLDSVADFSRIEG